MSELRDCGRILIRHLINLAFLRFEFSMLSIVSEPLSQDVTYFEEFLLRSVVDS